MQLFVQRWKAAKYGPALTDAYVPLVSPPGEACQFDWSHEHVELGGVMHTIKVAHFRLMFSHQMFVVAYPRETQEMVFDTHNSAFAYFGGVPLRMFYDNLKAVVETFFNGKERLFTPLARFASFEALNEWLATRCQELARRKHPVTPEYSIAACFVTEQPTLRRITAPYDCYVEHVLRVSRTCLVVLDRNRYSVLAAFAGRVVSVRSTATQVRIVADGAALAERARRFGRDLLICAPRHYLPIPGRKPGALRNGMPFYECDLPASIQRARTILDMPCPPKLIIHS